MPAPTQDTQQAELKTRAQATLDALTARLLQQAGDDGGWEGRLSSSALSTAVAAGALLAQAEHNPHGEDRAAAERGLAWIAAHQNRDGGWGDSPESPSNLATTLLSLAALHRGEAQPQAQEAARRWLVGRTGADEPLAWRQAVLDFYAEDKTFSVPILAFCTAGGLFETEGEAAWKNVPQLPFEFSLAPAKALRLLKLQVVSYALPALIAIGLVRHRQAPARNPLRWVRNAVTAPALRLLENIQPSGGGFLEAAPLTGFVLISLTTAGLATHPVSQKARGFLLDTQRGDGSWPIDTHLAGWLTCLAVDALPENALTPERREQLARLILARQTQRVHPYTRSEPGGWSWTPLSGGVPDGDDTAAALKALHRLRPEAHKAARAGCLWLAGLQNVDGGVPTFCRGWGQLPFDKSCPDITAHALRAWRLWLPTLDAPTARIIERAMGNASRFLKNKQQADGSWNPLWFGSQNHPQQQNPVFGTAQVLASLNPLPSHSLTTAREGAIGFLTNAQGTDGGWGAAKGLPPTIEETALATRALATLPDSKAQQAATAGIHWLVQALQEAPGDLPAAPIGLYFASLWYDEKLYPHLFSIDALRAWLERH